MNRLSQLDIHVLVNELQSLINCKLVNIYNLSTKTFLFKFSGSGEKSFLLVESGVRFHTTQYSRDIPDMPNNFCVKLRKHLRGKRLDKLEQLGLDRVIRLTFGDWWLVVEFYAGGNVILGTGNVIMCVLRVVDTIGVRVGETYQLEGIKREMTREEFVQILEKNSKNKLQKTLASSTFYGKDVVAHVLFKLGWSELKSRDVLEETDKVTQLFQNLDTEFNSIVSATQSKYIVTLDEEKKYTNYFSFDYAHLNQVQHINYPNFNECVDAFFTNYEMLRIGNKQENLDKLLDKKLKAIQLEHHTHIETLEEQQNLNRMKAQLIEDNCDLVQFCTDYLNQLISCKFDWEQINDLVEANAVLDDRLEAIQQLKLNINSFTIRLNATTDEEEESQEIEMQIDIRLDLTAMANARTFYAQKKTLSYKQQKAEEMANQALLSAQRKIQKDISSQQSKTTSVFVRRQPLWFEKFWWCLTSEKYLMVGGRDAQQNELLVKRYMEKTPSIIIKNPYEHPPPPSTLSQAATFAVCLSPNWESKVTAASYWVHSHQVSKTAPSGEYLPTGSFMIRGKRNFMAPNALVMASGIVWRVGEASVERHREERKSDGGNGAGDEWEKERERYNLDEVEEKQIVDIASDEEIVVKEVKKEKKSKDQRPVRKETQVPEKKKSDRGKKGKLKKIKKKYKDQDEEDRLEKMRLLGHKIPEKQQEDEGISGESRKVAETTENVDQAPVEAESVDKDSAKVEAEKIPIEANLLQQIEEDKAQDSTQSLSTDVTLLDSLTGIPFDDDELLYALPVVGPYASLSKYKYFVKLTPGPLKRGKAVKQISQLFQKKATPKDKEYIKLITDQEWILQMIGSTRVN